MEIYDDDCNTSDLDWSKMASKALNVGYKDGISSARESLYQKGFDAGFKAGLKSGFSLGFVHSILRKSPSVNASDSIVLKNNALRGNCQICVDENLLVGDSIKNVRDQQNTANDRNLEEIYEKYENVLQNKLSEKMNF